MAIGLGLELGSDVGVRVMARAWVRVRLWVVVCRNIAQFLTILHRRIAGGAWGAAANLLANASFRLGILTVICTCSLRVR